MTVDEMRKIMRGKVVPEEVVPQNVINCIIDEEAEPTKPDAFSFLMRLRSLGIGSADFLNLLIGCGAPDNVVEKIKNNPAMNLQGLVLTLENSELSTDDYTRMLLTARQVWERTLTLRIEKAQKISREFEHEEYSNYEDNVDNAKEINPPIDEVSDNEAEDTDLNYDEDLQELSFTAVFEKINKEMLDGTLSGNYSEREELSEEPAAQDDEEGGFVHKEENGFDFEESGFVREEEGGFIHEEESRFVHEEEGGFVHEEEDGFVHEEEGGFVHEEESGFVHEEESEFAPEVDYIPEEPVVRENTELSFSMAFDKIKAEKQVEFSQPKNIGSKFEEPALSENSVESEIKTARQSKSADSGKRVELPDILGQESHEKEKKKTWGAYHKKAIIAAAAGAVALICAAVVIGLYFVKGSAAKLHFAKDNIEIFNKIYVAYEKSYSGGELASGFGEDHHTIFGDMLISGNDEKRCFGNFSIGSEIYTISEENITVSVVKDGTLTALEDLTPPENARFVAAFDNDGELFALFSGKQSGYIKIADGKADYTVYQDGILTDYDFTNGAIKLGTVYTPVFTHSFGTSDEDVYLPKTGAGVVKPISPSKIIISQSEGYSYGVSAEYSVQNGEMTNVCAVIGDLVAASADGRFALNGESGILLKAGDDDLSTTKTGKLTRAAFGKNGCALSEKDVENVTLYDENLKAASALSGITEEIGGMWFDGNVLTINGKTDSLLRVDCADFSKPQPMTLRSENGIVAGNSAITFEVTEKAVVATRYDLENGSAKKISEFSKELPAEQLATVAFDDPKTVVMSGAKSGFSYKYFDGVSVVSEYVLFESGSEPRTVSVFDDKTGFTAAFINGGVVSAVCAGGTKVLQ